MIKTNYSSSLCIKVSLDDNCKIQALITNRLIPKNYQVFYVYDDKNGWLYSYSNYFEIISLDIIKAIKNLVEKNCSDSFFINIYDNRNYCFLIQKKCYIQCVGVNLWNQQITKNYIFFDNYIIAPFKTYAENIKSLSSIVFSLNIDLRLLFSGFDKRKNKPLIYKGKLDKNDNLPNIKIISNEGIFVLSHLSELRLDELRDEYKDILLFFGDSVNIDPSKSIYEIYFIVNKDCICSFEYDGKKYLFCNDEIIRIINFDIKKFRVLEFNVSIITIACPFSFKNYKRYDKREFAETRTNISGIHCLNDNMFCYQHKERICPWTNKESEWNIDSVSSIETPFPCVAVSRKEFERDDISGIDFKLLRSEEIPHFHPAFLEMYKCLNGILELEININNKKEDLLIKANEIAIIMPNVPHHIKYVYFQEKKYKHSCIQIFSKFHYPFYTTKRNYEFQEEIDLIKE